MTGLDHVVFGAATLEEGARHVEALLGAPPGPGGAHAGAGTHNRLMGLGPGLYLEVIARDPGQPDPALPRLFGLDDPARRAAGPEPIAWVARTDRLAGLAPRLGPARCMTRGALSWTLAEPPPGADFDGLLPAMIDWGPAGPPPGPADAGCRLAALEGEHPDAEGLEAALRALGLAGTMAVRRAPRPRLVLRLSRADGRVVEAASA